MPAIEAESSEKTGNHKPSIVVVIGTRAQLIKMAPVLLEMEKRSFAYRLILTGQHELTMDHLLREFGITTQPEPLFAKREIGSVIQMMFWFPRAVLRLVRSGNGRKRRAENTEEVLLAHGDTASTLIAAIAGRLRGALVAHVEAGLRSFNLLDPFPEELVRVLVTRLSTLSFAPGTWASSNLNSSRSIVIDTGANTLLDSVRFALARSEPNLGASGSDYCVVSIHRFETLISRKRLQWLLAEIGRLQGQVRVVFVLHPATRRKLHAYGLYSSLVEMSHVELRDRMTYVPFITLLRNSKFVITDGGSNQEELSYMGKPVLILRKSTERREGLGANAELCPFGSECFRALVREASTKSDGGQLDKLKHWPSRMIVDRLIGHASSQSGQ